MTDYTLTPEIVDSWYTWDVEDVDRIGEFIDAINDADSIEDWSLLLSGSFRDDLNEHIKPGNNKLGKNILIFNTGSAHDCPNIGTEHCQVDELTCYAARDERNYELLQPDDDGGPLSYRRRQQLLWDILDAETFSKAVGRVIDRRKSETGFLRIGEAGDFAHDGELRKADEIARRLWDSHNVIVYCYSASDYLSWDSVEHLVVNASNGLAEYGVRRFLVVNDPKEAPAGAMQCPYDRTDGEVGCGDPCTACMSESAPDVYVTAH